MASAITMDPPHLVHTGAACASCFALAPGKLLRCSSCSSAWYCNQDCQRKGFKEHKVFCKTLRLFHTLQTSLPPESWPRTARDFHLQRVSCQQVLEPKLRRPLSRGEHRAILGEAKCSVCMRTRAQLARSAATSRAPGSPSAAIVVAGGAADAAAAPATDGSGGGGSGCGDGGKIASAASRVGTPEPPTRASAPGGNTAAAATVTAPTPTPTLSCCPHCNWGWACPEHLDAYLAGPHATVCMPYKNMNDSQLLTQNYLSATGRVPNYVPDALRRPPGASTASAAVAGWEPVPAGWAAFQGWRPLPVLDQSLLCLLTKRMSQALTVVQALQHHYTPEQLAARSHLEVHVLGASSFEVPADRIWEELLNLMPQYDPTAAAAAADISTLSVADPGSEGPGKAASGGSSGSDATSNVAPVSAAAGAARPAVAAPAGGTVSKAVGPRVLHVAFVGPELGDIIVDESDGRALAQGTSLSAPPPPPDRELLYSYHLCTYQEFAAGRTPRSAAAAAAAAAVPAVDGGREARWRRPDLAVAFNSGISDSDQRRWAPALEVLVRAGVPVVFTSYNGVEADADAAAWRAAGGAVTLGPERNPYRALEPIMEPSQVDVFYYHNYYWWCGRAAGSAAQQA